MDELFTRYVYYERAKQGNRNTATEALREFYARDSYKLLKSEETLANLSTVSIAKPYAVDSWPMPSTMGGQSLVPCSLGGRSKTKTSRFIELNTVFEIEHIYAKKREEVENGNKSKLKALGNKTLLEKRINILSSDYRFEDKKNYYRGFESARGPREGTGNRELLLMADGQADFTMQTIDARTASVIDAFMDCLCANGLLLS